MLLLTDRRKLIFFLPAPQKQIKIPNEWGQVGSFLIEGDPCEGWILSPTRDGRSRLKCPTTSTKPDPAECTWEKLHCWPSSSWKLVCNFAQGDQTASQGRCQEQNEIPNKLAMSEKPIQHRIKAHKENTIYSAYLVRILNDPALVFSPRAESPWTRRDKVNPPRNMGLQIHACVYVHSLGELPVHNTVFLWIFQQRPYMSCGGRKLSPSPGSIWGWLASEWEFIH